MRTRLPLAALAVLAAAAAPGTASAAGWIPMPPLAEEAILRGAVMRADGAAQVLFASVPGGADPLELAVGRPLGSPWQAPVTSGLPAGLTTVTGNANGDLVAWGVAPDGRLLVSSRGTASRMDTGDWSPPAVLATGVRSAAVALSDDREAIAAWNASGGAVLVALRGRFGTWGGPRVLEPSGATPRAPLVAVNEVGDAVVAWVRGRAGRRTVRAATRRASSTTADLPFEDARSVSRHLVANPRLGGAALSLTGDATVAWVAVRSPGSGPLRTATHRAGAPAWAAPVTVARLADSPALGVAAAGGAVIAWSAREGLRVAQRAAGARAWRAVPPPRPSDAATALAVTRLGDVGLAAWDGDTDRVRFLRRAPGRRAWQAAPGAVALPPLPVVLRANAAGDMVAAWAYPRSNSSAPIEGIAYEAAPLPLLTRLRAHPEVLRPGATTRLTFRLSAPGRVLVTLRRPFGGRTLAAFVVAGRRGPNAVVVPRPAIARLLGPGRYVVLADTSARRGGLRTAVIRTTP